MTMERWWCGVRRAALLLHTKNNISSSSLSSPYHTIQAIPREYTGSRVAAKDRAQGRIPTVVFARETDSPPAQSSSVSVSRKQLLTTERKQINSLLKTVQVPFFCSTTFQLQIRAGSGSSHLLESGTVLPIKLHRDPQSGSILNLVLVWAEKGSHMDVRVPIVFKGEELSPGLKKGGHLKGFRRSLKLQGPIEDIPSKIEVDVSNLDIGDRVFMRDVEIHPSLKILNKTDLPLCKVMATKPKNLEPMGVQMISEASEPLVV